MIYQVNIWWEEGPTGPFLAVEVIYGKEVIKGPGSGLPGKIGMILSFVYGNGTSKNCTVHNPWICTQQPCLSWSGMIRNLLQLEGKVGRVEKQKKIYPELGQHNRLGFCQRLTLKVTPPPPLLDEGLYRLLPLGSLSPLNQQGCHWTGAKVKPNQEGEMLSTLQFVLLHNSGLNKSRNQRPVLPLFWASSLAYSLSTLLCLVKLGKPGWEVVPHLPDL